MSEIILTGSKKKEEEKMQNNLLLHAAILGIESGTFFWWPIHGLG